MIELSSGEDNKDYIKSFEEIRKQIEARDEETISKGVSRLKRLLRAYRKPNNMDKEDFYLL